MLAAEIRPYIYKLMDVEMTWVADGYTMTLSTEGLDRSAEQLPSGQLTAPLSI